MKYEFSNIGNVRYSCQSDEIGLGHWMTGHIPVHGDPSSNKNFKSCKKFDIVLSRMEKNSRWGRKKKITTLAHSLLPPKKNILLIRKTSKNLSTTNKINDLKTN